MTPKQISLYWRKWSLAKKVLISMAGMSPAEAEAERHEIHRRALGADISHTQLRNQDLDKVLDAFASYSLLLTGPTTGPTRAEDQPARRLRWAIDQLGLPDPYLDSIARDQFGVDSWRTLKFSDLLHFRYTAVHRASARAKKHAAATSTPPAP
jgi:hypothetical protein